MKGQRYPTRVSLVWFSSPRSTCIEPKSLPTLYKVQRSQSLQLHCKRLRSHSCKKFSEAFRFSFSGEHRWVPACCWKTYFYLAALYISSHMFYLEWGKRMPIVLSLKCLFENLETTKMSHLLFCYLFVGCLKSSVNYLNIALSHVVLLVFVILKLVLSMHFTFC